MNQKRLALLTGLTLMTGPLINNVEWLRNTTIQEAAATQIKTNLKPTKKYPDVTKELDVTSMQQYTSSNLFMNVTLSKFYIKDAALDDQGQYHLLLAPIKTSDQYFLLVTKSSQIIRTGRRLTVQGFLSGKTNIGSEQIKSGLNKKYLNKKVVSIAADNISIY